MQYQTVTQLSMRWGINPQRIRALLKEGRIEGAIKPGHDWLIPATTEKPEDGRRKKGLE